MSNEFLPPHSLFFPLTPPSRCTNFLSFFLLLLFWRTFRLFPFCVRLCILMLLSFYISRFIFLVLARYTFYFTSFVKIVRLQRKNIPYEYFKYDNMKMSTIIILATMWKSNLSTILQPELIVFMSMYFIMSACKILHSTFRFFCVFDSSEICQTFLITCKSFVVSKQ